MVSCGVDSGGHVMRCKWVGLVSVKFNCLAGTNSVGTLSKL